MSLSANFQSTSLSRGKTYFFSPFSSSAETFNPLPSHEGRPSEGDSPYYISNLSIHFPLTREDFSLLRCRNMPVSFNPLPSHEGRLPEDLAEPRPPGLSIHFPLTREDRVERILLFPHDLSIHFPLTREDRRTWPNHVPQVLSIHFPLTREDKTMITSSPMTDSFNPLPSHEGRPWRRNGVAVKKPFNPLPSHEGRPF